MLRREAGAGPIPTLREWLPMSRYEGVGTRHCGAQYKRWVAGAMLVVAVDLPEIEFYPIDISFDRIADPDRRRYFMNLPTSFALPPDAVDSCAT